MVLVKVFLRLLILPYGGLGLSALILEQCNHSKYAITVLTVSSSLVYCVTAGTDHC